MRVFRGFVLGLVFVMVFGCLSGCVNSLDNDEQEQWDKCSQAFKRVNPLLFRAAMKVLLLIISLL